MQFTKTLFAAAALVATTQAANSTNISSNGTFNGSANAAGSVQVSSSILGAAAAVSNNNKRIVETELTEKFGKNKESDGYQLVDEGSNKNIRIFIVDSGIDFRHEGIIGRQDPNVPLFRPEVDTTKLLSYQGTNIGFTA